MGFLGDGVNDALALHAADVGLSVDTAADVAEDAADVVLLEKDLGVLADGVAEGRRIFANTIKYVLMGTSSNFGNMFSAAAASAVLNFLPMLPGQILRSTPSRPLVLAAFAAVAVGVALPFTPLSHLLGFQPLPLGFLATLAGMVVAYLGLIEVAKRIFFANPAGRLPLPRLRTRSSHHHLQRRASSYPGPRRQRAA